MAISWKAVTSHIAAALAGSCLTSLAYKQISTPSENEITNKRKEEKNNLQKQRQQQQQRQHSPTIITKSNPISPLSPITIFNPNPHIEIAYDNRTRNPLYVLEHLHPHAPITVNNRNNNDDPFKFHENTLLPVPYRSRNGYYRNSGYDRGHLAPAADFKHDESATRDSFSLCNVSPQIPSFNRMTWARLEHIVRLWGVEEGGGGRDTYVVTGPLWLPKEIVVGGGREETTTTTKTTKGVKYRFIYEGIGDPPSLISVPTHFFKVVVILEKNTRRIEKFAAFVLPNEEVTTETKNAPLSRYLVRLTDLETVSGMRFFSGLWGGDGDDDDESSKELANALTETVWMETSKGNNMSQSMKRDVVPYDDSGALDINLDAISRRRRQKIKQILREKDDDVLKHLCSHGRCN